ncbi:DUF2752 domain-containing protein [Filimonas zeae]|uniref:DUF2752 domain-containing protein n=1 Tax=Filimonas zeae TaxID=1737353 RepID=UPI0016646AC8
MARVDSSLGDKLLFAVWLLIPLLIFQINYHSGNEHFTLCLFKNITGNSCYGCGVLRGISACMHLNFEAAYHLNHLNVLSIPLLTFLYFKKLWQTGTAFFRLPQ